MTITPYRNGTVAKVEISSNHLQWYEVNNCGNESLNNF